MKRLRDGLVVAAILVSALAPAYAAPTVVPPESPVAGQSQLSLSEQWWQWVMGIPRATNPVMDPTGQFASINNNGPVFFIGGLPGAGTLARSFNVPADRPIFFPLLNAINVSSHYFDGVEAYCPEQPDPLGCAFFWISDWVDHALEVHASLDGQALAIFPNTRQTSTGFFPVTVPEDDLFGWNDPPVALPAGTFPAVSDGHWMAVEGMPIGQHVLEFGGIWGGGERLHLIANLNVIPEPSSALALLAGLGALGAMRRRRKV